MFSFSSLFHLPPQQNVDRPNLLLAPSPFLLLAPYAPMPTESANDLLSTNQHEFHECKQNSRQFVKIRGQSARGPRCLCPQMSRGILGLGVWVFGRRPIRPVTPKKGEAVSQPLPQEGDLRLPQRRSGFPTASTRRQHPLSLEAERIPLLLCRAPLPRHATLP